MNFEFTQVQLPEGQEAVLIEKDALRILLNKAKGFDRGISSKEALKILGVSMSQFKVEIKDLKGKLKKLGHNNWSENSVQDHLVYMAERHNKK